MIHFGISNHWCWAMLLAQFDIGYFSHIILFYIIFLILFFRYTVRVLIHFSFNQIIKIIYLKRSLLISDIVIKSRLNRISMTVDSNLIFSPVFQRISMISSCWNILSNKIKKIACNRAHAIMRILHEISSNLTSYIINPSDLWLTWQWTN